MAASDPLRKLSRDLAGEKGRVGARVAQVVRKTASDITRDARINSPVDTGNLRSSIGHTLTGDGRNRTIRAEIGPTASYAGFLEFGTSRMAPRPYLFPAADRHEAAFLAAMSQAAEPKL